MLPDAVYLDHAGTTLYSKSLMERHMTDMMSNLYGNPHSASASSQLSTNRIDDARLKVLRFFKADPEDFDVVFVANTTAGIKLVMEAFRAHDGGPKSGGKGSGGFNYGYHKDSHTSVVGVRENAVASRCLDDEAVERWLCGSDSLVDKSDETVLNLFAYPAQSNLDGRRLPLSWLRKARVASAAAYTLLDASALVSTSQLDLSVANEAPDFTVVSFYKIFGYPSLGALIVRKDSGSILLERKYFGGGTVDVVLCVKEQWHVPKGQSLHEALEDGTLPFHNIMALDAALHVHKKLYGSMDRIASHTNYLAQKLFDGLKSLRHANGTPVCVMHSHGFCAADIFQVQGPVVAFNLKNSHGAWVSNVEFEKLATVRKFHIRSGGLCNPGGVATHLNLEPWEMRQNFSAGLRCGAETDIYAGKITGIIRTSFGAMSTDSDVEAFASFVKEFYVELDVTSPLSDSPLISSYSSNLVVESIAIYPIKSCGGLSISPTTAWEVRQEGLAWDREWCLVHQGSGQALSQKRHPRMTLIRPTLDFQQGLRYHGVRLPGVPEQVSSPLSSNPSLYRPVENMKSFPSRVCGDTIVARTYASKEINDFFSDVLGVPCSLARFPAGGSGLSTRHSKAHMQKHQWLERTPPNETTVPGSYPAPPTPPDSDNESLKRPILLSNESPILAINRSSLDALNDEITRTGGKPASASVFRANIVFASGGLREQQPYCEDHWTSLRIGQQRFQMLGSCRRCHMICVNQDTAEKDEEPFVTLAKTRRFESKIFFGSHMCHVPSKSPTRENQCPTIRVGDVVSICAGDE